MDSEILERLSPIDLIAWDLAYKKKMKKIQKSMLDGKWSPGPGAYDTLPVAVSEQSGEDLKKALDGNTVALGRLKNKGLKKWWNRKKGDMI